jgi:hypothetical protein
MFPPEPDSETEFSATIELAHEDPYDGELTSVIQLPEAPYMLSIQSASLDQSANPPPSSVLSPQPMRYPQLAPLLSISIPSGNEIPALESTSSSPASSSSQSTPLLGYQSGMYDPNFVTGEFGYDRYAFPFAVVVFRLILTRVAYRSQFQTYCVPRSYPQFDQSSLILPMGCSFDESSHQVYTVEGSGQHFMTIEGLSNPYNDELLARPQFVPY